MQVFALKNFLMLDLGFSQFELKKWLAKTETPAETETLAERSETVRNCPKLFKTS